MECFCLCLCPCLCVCMPRVVQEASPVEDGGGGPTGYVRGGLGSWGPGAPWRGRRRRRVWGGACDGVHDRDEREVGALPRRRPEVQFRVGHAVWWLLTVSSICTCSFFFLCRSRQDTFARHDTIVSCKPRLFAFLQTSQRAIFPAGSIVFFQGALGTRSRRRPNSSWRRRV